MSTSYGLHCLQGEAKDRYLKKLQDCDLTECPYLIPEDAWVNQPTSWPSLEYPDMYEYLINTPGVFTREAMKNRKSLEAYQYFASGFVRTVLMLNPEYCGNVSVLKAKVLPSQRVRDEEHMPWVAVGEDNSIITAHCSCKAGLGESCSHVAAMLFKIEAAVRAGYTRSTCTERPCEWNNDFVTAIKAAPVANISFFSDKAVSKEGRKRKRMELDVQLDEESFLSSLSGLQQSPIALSCFSKYCDRFIPTNLPPTKAKVPPNLRTLYDSKNAAKSNVEIETMAKAMLDKVNVSPEEIVYVESQTRKQAGCALWHELRCGRITASTAYDVLHTDHDKPSSSLIMRICNQKSSSYTSVPALQWGIQNESAAIEKFSDVFAPQHMNLEVLKCGLKLGGANCFLGATPDGIVTCSCHPSSLLEVKCPFSLRETDSLTQAISNKGTEFCLDNTGVLKKTHRYYAQVQLQMFVFGTKLSHFVIWTPQWIHITEVERNDDYLSESLPKLEQFHLDHILPEILTRKMENCNGAQTDAENKSKDLLCYCRKPYDNGTCWIGCDNLTCRYKWFHFSCVAVVKAPKGKWYCPDCKRLSINTRK